MYKLFVYGSLRDKGVQNILFGRNPESVPYTLKGYKLVVCEDGYYTVCINHCTFVYGQILTLTGEELAICDMWEEVPVYERRLLQPLEDVYIYIKDIDKEPSKRVLAKGRLSVYEDCMQFTKDLRAKEKSNTK
jgi:gamma-glutamylcyclotransferase (GGCT)/AIG2-like uncharacterized protein YtfP